MIINNVIVDSFQEYEGKHSLVIFSKGCNLDCVYCYNKNSMNKDGEDAIKIIKSNLNQLHEAVVFLGGEPTIWEDLPEVAKYCKDKGLSTKLYTNGLNPEVLLTLLDNDLIDSYSVDIKVARNLNILGKKYPDYLDTVLESLFLIESFKKDVEVRTTLCEGVDIDEIKFILMSYFPNVRHIIQTSFTTKN